MAATWEINTMERNLSDGGVTVAHWRVHDSKTVGDDTLIAESFGACNFSPNPSAADFIAYGDLTESKVLEWVHAAQNIDKDVIEASLAAQLTEQETPTKGQGVPW